MTTLTIDELCRMRWELCWQTPWDDLGSHEKEVEREALRAVLRALEPAFAEAWECGTEFAPGDYPCEDKAEIFARGLVARIEQKETGSWRR